MMAIAEHAKAAFDIGKELGQKEVAIAIASARGVNEERSPAFRGDDQKVADLLLPAEVFDQAPATAAEQHLLVLSQAVEEVERRIFPALLLFVAGRQHYAIAHRASQNAAVQDAA